MADVIVNTTTYPMMMEKINEMYGEKYNEWYDAMTKPIGTRCPANPHPWTYFHGSAELQALYIDSSEYVAANGNIEQMVDHLIELFLVCKEPGRGLYFSQTMIDLGLTAAAKKMVALAFVIGMLQGRFNTDLFCEVEYVEDVIATGDTKIAAEKEAMQKVADDTGCAAVMLVVDARNETTLELYHTLPYLKRFVAEGFHAYRGPRSDFPFSVGLWRKPTIHELVIEVEYRLARDVHRGFGFDPSQIPLWHRMLNRLSPEEEEAALLLH